MRHYSTSTRSVRAVRAESVIKKNMEKHAAKLKALSVFSGIGILVCFIGFGVLGFTMLGSSGFPAVILIPFFGFAIFGFLTSYFSMKATAAASAVKLMNQVKSSDRTDIENLCFAGTAPADVLYMLRLLIQTENLADYEIIADKVIAKKSLGLKPEDLFEPAIPADKDSAGTNKCPNCGAVNSGRECPYCGFKFY